MRAFRSGSFGLSSHGSWFCVLRSEFFVLRSEFFVLRSEFFVLRSGARDPGAVATRAVAPGASRRSSRRADYRRRSAVSIANPSPFSRPRPASTTSSTAAVTRFTASIPKAKPAAWSSTSAASGDGDRTDGIRSRSRTARLSSPTRPTGASVFRCSTFAGTWISGFTLPGPRRVARQHRRAGAQRRRHARLPWQRDRAQSAGNRCADHGVRARRHTGPQHRQASRDRPRGRSAAAPRHERRDSRCRTPDGGYFFVFLAGRPVFYRYDAKRRVCCSNASCRAVNSIRSSSRCRRHGRAGPSMARSCRSSCRRCGPPPSTAKATCGCRS